MRILCVVAFLALAGCEPAAAPAPRGATSSAPSAPAAPSAMKPAPPLSGVTWLTGEPFENYTPGKTYVLEFWATWCGPCISAMPHLAELQRKHAAEGLEIVLVTSIDGNNPRDKVEEFVDKNADRLGLSFVAADDKNLENAFFPNGLRAIPTSVVVDKAGQVAFIGHPMDLDEVLPAVIKGTYVPNKRR